MGQLGSGLERLAWGTMQARRPASLLYILA